MGLFSSLSDRLNHIFSKLTKRGKLTELEIKEAMREVRIALLEADVSYMVAKKVCCGCFCQSGRRRSYEKFDTWSTSYQNR